MLFLVIETFRDGDPRPVYRRFAERGRLAPAGLAYVSSWVTRDLRRCFQVMECDDAALLEEWMAQWRDIVDFEVVPVVTSAEAAAAVAALPAAAPPAGEAPAPFKLTALQPGDRLRVIRAFTDFDDVAWAEGQTLEFVDYGYVPYDGGYTFTFREGTLRLAHGSDDRVLRRPEDFFARVAPGA